MIKIGSREEMDEFSLYCIVEGDTFTMPLAREEYILDVTTELQKNEQVGPLPEPGARASQTQGSGCGRDAGCMSGLLGVMALDTRLGQWMGKLEARIGIETRIVNETPESSCLICQIAMHAWI